MWDKIDCLVTPTAGTIYRIAEMQADPIRLNANLGYYTNFMNLLDYAAIAVPAGFQDDGLPFGITLAAPAHQDMPLLHLADRLLHRAKGTSAQEDKLLAGRVRVAVCGAHLAGLPLNHQLTSRGAHLVARTTSSADYKLYALPGGPPYRPGMVRVAAGESGSAIEVEVWEMAAREFGSFVAGIPAPLGIGTITLADGRTGAGFCVRAVCGARCGRHYPLRRLARLPAAKELMPMELQLFKTLWGHSGSLTEAADQAVAAGFAGLEGNADIPQTRRDELQSALQTRGLRYIQEIVTAGDYVPRRQCHGGRACRRCRAPAAVRTITRHRNG